MNSESDFASNYREAHCLLSHWWGRGMTGYIKLYSSNTHFNTTSHTHMCLGF